MHYSAAYIGCDDSKSLTSLLMLCGVQRAAKVGQRHKSRQKALGAEEKWLRAHQRHLAEVREEYDVIFYGDDIVEAWRWGVSSQHTISHHVRHAWLTRMLSAATVECSAPKPLCIEVLCAGHSKPKQNASGKRRVLLVNSAMDARMLANALLMGCACEKEVMK